MQKNLTIIFMITFYSCGGDSSTNPPSIDYHTDDQQFIEDLVSANGIINTETITERIATVPIDSGSISYYRIEKLYLGNMGLDSIPASIGNLVSLNVLMLNNNNFKYLTESICTIYNQLDSLDVTNNDICTPNVPDCIINTLSTTAFYDNQQCEIIPDEEDMDFIIDLITENWGASDSPDKFTVLSNLTTWETFAEGNIITSRITEIRYDDQEITKIPISLEDVDSLERIELQENQIESIPNIIGNLSRLKYMTIQKNNITTIPARIGDLEHLEVFKIYENQLIEVHENIGQLSKVISLNLSHNQLESLPDSMCNILSNPDIQISIDNNKICNGYPDCFISLVSNSDGQACSP